MVDVVGDDDDDDDNDNEDGGGANNKRNITINSSINKRKIEDDIGENNSTIISIWSLRRDVSNKHDDVARAQSVNESIASRYFGLVV